MSNVKNYTEQGGEKTVIGGTLEFTDDAQVVNLPGGSITSAAYQADSTATTVSALKDDFNVLLAKLKAAGFVESTAPAVEPDPDDASDDEAEEPTENAET